jgi:hypothetical protein
MLSDAWPTLNRSQQRTAGEQLGQVLRVPHAWEPPTEIRVALVSDASQTDTSDVIGAALNPLPVDRALRLIEPATHLDNVDRALYGYIVQLGEELELLRGSTR